MYRFCLAILILPMIVGCNESLMTNLQRRDLQSKDLEGNYDNAFKANLQVFQDYGYIIKSADYDSGVIHGATATKRKSWLSGLMISSEITATIEQFQDNLIKERISIVDKSKSSSQYGTHENSKIVETPETYQKIYDDIQKEMFVRKNLSK